MPSSTLANAHARDLLARLGLAGAPEVASDHPALAWRRAGLMDITGQADAPGLVAPVALSAAADGALAALKSLAPQADWPANGALLLGERSRLLGLRRQGRISANGSCRLLDTRDGLIALNLPRESDWELVPAWLGEPAPDWVSVARAVGKRSRGELLTQGRLLGLAIAADAPPAITPAPFTITHLGPPRGAKTVPLVLDFSSLWAGPLAGALLGAAGARVIKIESASRPDGARFGEKRFFHLLNGRKERLSFDFGKEDDLRRLRALANSADIIIESSRPRALTAVGLDAAEHAARGAVWLSITAYGRTGEAANWVGFGDDAAVAGGLASAMQRGWGESLFAGDAIADPLTGITAALAAYSTWHSGGGCVISLAMADVVAHACTLYETAPDELREWQEMAEADGAPLYALRA